MNLGRTDFLWAGLTVVMQVTASVNFQGTLLLYYEVSNYEVSNHTQWSVL